MIKVLCAQILQDRQIFAAGVGLETHVDIAVSMIHQNRLRWWRDKDHCRAIRGLGLHLEKEYWEHTAAEHKLLCNRCNNKIPSRDQELAPLVRSTLLMVDQKQLIEYNA